MAEAADRGVFVCGELFPAALSARFLVHGGIWECQLPRAGRLPKR